MESHLSINPLQANLQDLTQAATNLQADLATHVAAVRIAVANRMRVIVFPTFFSVANDSVAVFLVKWKWREAQFLIT